MHLIHDFATGGAENGIVNILNRLDPSSFEPAACAFVGKGQLTKRLDLSRIRLFEMDKRKGNDPSLPFRLYRLFKKWRPDIVHTHSWGTLLEGWVGARLAGVPVLIHGEHGTMMEKKRNIFLQRFLWKRFGQVLSVSSAHRDKLCRIIGFPKEKISVIVNGVDTEKFHPGSNNPLIRQQLGIQEGHVVIGAVGRLVPVKNHALLVHAMKLLLETNPKVSLVIVGDGPLEGELRELVKDNGLSSRVFFTGRRSDIDQVLQSFDIFVLSSLSEGLSNTVLEAMSCGLPVVATDVGGNSEMVRHDETGFLVPSGKPQEMATALSLLVQNPEGRMMMGKIGRKRIEDHFSMDQMIRNYELLYFSLTEKFISSHKVG